MKQSSRSAAANTTGKTIGTGGRFRLLAVLAVALVAVAPAAGQRDAEQGGEAAGRLLGEGVGDPTGEPVSGASVYLEGMFNGAITNMDGRYLIRDVSAGSHAVVVRVIGFATKRVTNVIVMQGQTATLDVSVSPQAVELDAVTVSAAVERGSTQALTSERRRAGVVLDAIGAEQISRSPDGDAAAVLARAPGVSVVDGRYVYVRGLGDRYGAATLNGSPMPSPEPDRKVVPLDIVPSSFLESVVTAKTYSPDQPGDYAGGLVQIRTRNFPAERITELGVGVGYNSRSTFAGGLGNAGGAYDFLALDDGTRALPDIVPERRVTLGSYPDYQLERIGEAFVGEWGPVSTELPPAQSFSFALGNRASWGDGDTPVGYLIAVTQSTDVSNKDDVVERVVGGAEQYEVDYSGTSTTRSASLGAMANFSIEATPTNRLTLAGLYNRTAEDEGRIFQGYNHDFGVNQRNTRIRYLSQDLLSAQLKGEHELSVLGDSRLSWRSTLSRSSRYEPNTREVLYRQVPDGRYLFDTFVQSGSVFHSDLDERGHGAAIDLQVPLELRGLPASLSLGAMLDVKDRETVSRRFRFLPIGSLSDEIRAREPSDLFTEHTIGPSGFQIQEATFPGDNYTAGQRIAAAYAMVDAEVLPRLRLTGGARVEQAAQSVTPVNRFLSTTMDLDPANLDNTDILPGINITYGATPDVNLRLGVSRTLGRPQFRELAPFQFTDYAGGFLVIGNPALRRSLISNYDVRLEWFPGPGSLVAVSGFYKHFDDPIEAMVLSSTELMQTWINADGAENYGAEAEVRASLGGIASGFEDFFVNANLTIVRSEVNTGGTAQVYLPFGAGLTELSRTARSRALQGQSPYVVNLALNYLSSRWGTNLSALYNRYGRRIDTVGDTQLPDIYEEGRGRFDLVVEQPFGSGLSGKLSAKRLLGSDMEFTQGGRVVRAYDLGRAVSLSVSWNIGG